MKYYWYCVLQSDMEHQMKISQQREKQQELIHQLKSQLEDLENYAYEVGIYIIKSVQVKFDK